MTFNSALLKASFLLGSVSVYPFSSLRLLCPSMYLVCNSKAKIFVEAVSVAIKLLAFCKVSPYTVLTASCSFLEIPFFTLRLIMCLNLGNLLLKNCKVFLFTLLLISHLIPPVALAYRPTELNQLLSKEISVELNGSFLANWLARLFSLSCAALIRSFST